MNELRDRDRDRDRQIGVIRNHQPARVWGIQRIGWRTWSNNFSQQSLLEKGPTLWGMVPYGLRARERRWHREDNIFDSTPAGTDHSLRISGERLGGKRQV